MKRLFGCGSAAGARSTKGITTRDANIEAQ